MHLNRPSYSITWPGSIFRSFLSRYRTGNAGRVGRHIPLGITDTPNAAAQIQAKHIKALAIRAPRFAALPDVPTFAESGCRARS